VEAVQPRARVRVVENVVDTDVFHPPTEPPPAAAPPPGDAAGPARLLTVAALADKKGHAYLLQALAQLRADGATPVTLDLVGDGEEREPLERLTRALGIEDIVRFVGEQPKERVAEMMREADLFVLPSLYENLPCVLIEATASGLPCVATSVGGVPEIVDSDNGVLCPPRDAAALAGAIAAALDRAPPVDPAALAGRATARFGYEAFERNWTALYEELVSEAGRPRPAR
jgi:glycosyltransferase involved in cell wall biosynthesis